MYRTFNVFSNKLIQSRFFRSTSVDETNPKLKVTICGAAGSIGKVVAFFLKQSNYSLDLALYDVSPKLCQLTKELKLINTMNSIEEYIGPLKLRQALKNSDVVAVFLKTAGNSSKVFSNDSFDLNFPAVSSIAKSVIELCPDAILAISTNPLNYIIPAVNEIYKLHGCYSPHKIIGITAPDSMQAGVTYADFFKYDPSDVFIPLVGGTSEDSMVPIFSQATPNISGGMLQTSESEKLHTSFITHKQIMSLSDLSAGFAVTRFIESIIRAILGETDIVDTAFVHNGAIDGASKYMTSLVDLNENGVRTVYGPPANMSRFEIKILHTAISNLNRDISHAERYVAALHKTERRYRRVE
ncbi:hypothetical protein ACFFRR_000256 [Megaselia abdita]